MFLNILYFQNMHKNDINFYSHYLFPQNLNLFSTKKVNLMNFFNTMHKIINFYYFSLSHLILLHSLESYLVNLLYLKFIYILLFFIANTSLSNVVYTLLLFQNCDTNVFPPNYSIY